MVVVARRLEAVPRFAKDLMSTPRPLHISRIDPIPMSMAWELAEHMSLYGYAVGNRPQMDGIDKRYWRMSSRSGKSLFSFDIDGSSGALVGFEVTVYEGGLREWQPSRLHTVKRQGHLIADLLAWPAEQEGTNRWRFLEEEGTFELQMHGESLRISLYDSPCATLVRYEGDVHFELNAANENRRCSTGQRRK